MRVPPRRSRSPRSRPARRRLRQRAHGRARRRDAVPAAEERALHSRRRGELPRARRLATRPRPGAARGHHRAPAARRSRSGATRAPSRCRETEGDLERARGAAQGRQGPRPGCRELSVAVAPLDGRPAIEVAGPGRSTASRARRALAARLRRGGRGRRRRPTRRRTTSPASTGGLRAGPALAAIAPPRARGVSRRAVVVVLDACGVGALPDAADYGDAGANTLAHLAEAVGGLDVPVLERLGLGLDRADRRRGAGRRARGVHGRLAPSGRARTRRPATGSSWASSPPAPLPTYPSGFPPRWSARSSRPRARAFCCNRPTTASRRSSDFGERHLRDRRGHPLHVAGLGAADRRARDVVAEEELTRRARPPRGHAGEHAVGRVIARPFRGEPGRVPARTRAARTSRSRRRRAATSTSCRPTACRCTPWARSATCSPAAGSTRRTRRHERAALARRPRCWRSSTRGLVFANLVETDQVYGHRKDVEGFHARAAASTRVGDGSTRCATATCSSSPPTTAATPPRPTPTTRASTRPLLATFAGPRRPAPRRRAGRRRRDGAVQQLTGRDAIAFLGTPFRR